MQGKYTTIASYAKTKCQRAVLRALLRPLIRWRPMAAAQEGCTILIGCTAPLARMLGATLAMLDRQQMPCVREVIVVVDRPAASIGFDVEHVMCERFPRLPLKFIFYTPLQARVLGLISWGWAYAWLSWAIGLAHTRTRYAFLQDFDAMLLRPDFIEERYRAIRERQVQYLGLRLYSGGGGDRGGRCGRYPRDGFRRHSSSVHDSDRWTCSAMSRATRGARWISTRFCSPK